MTPTEPTEPTEPQSITGTEPQQKLARELEEIAAKQLQKPDDETVVLYDQEHPENEVNHEHNNRKADFERNIGELQKQVVNALVEFSQRATLVNREAQGEEDLAVDALFVKVVSKIRERVIDRVPDLSDQCWKVSDKARKDELDSLKKLDSIVDSARGELLDSTARVVESLEGLKSAVSQEAEDKVINDVVRTNNNNIVDSLDYAEKELARVPRYYGEVVEELEEMIGSYVRLMEAAGRPLDVDERDDFRKFFNEQLQGFDRLITERTRLERERIANLSKDMHNFYAEQYTVKMQEALAGLEVTTESA